MGVVDTLGQYTVRKDKKRNNLLEGKQLQIKLNNTWSTFVETKSIFLSSSSTFSRKMGHRILDGGGFHLYLFKFHFVYPFHSSVSVMNYSETITHA